MGENLWLGAITEANLKSETNWLLSEILLTESLAEKWSLSMKTGSKVHLELSKSHSLLEKFM